MKVGDLVWYVGFGFNKPFSESYVPRIQDIGIVMEYLGDHYIKVYYPDEPDWKIAIHQREDLRILNEDWKSRKETTTC